MIRSLCLYLSIFVLSGCATVNRGATDYFRIDTVPQGATAVTSIETRESKIARKRNNELKPIYHSCEPTPCAIGLSRHSKFIVTLTHPGYEPTELFITNSPKSAAYVANTASTVTTVASATAGSALLTATAIGITAQVSGAIVGSLASVASGGLISSQAVVAGASSAAPSTGAVFAASIPPALAVTGTMLAIDAGTGANNNLYPNPVSLSLTPIGLPTKTDPLVPEFRKVLTAQDKVFLNCKVEKKRHPSQVKNISENCKLAKDELQAVKKTHKQTVKDLIQ